MASKSLAPRKFRIAAVLIGLLASSAAFAVTVVVTSAADVVTICASTGHPSVSGGEGCTLRDAILFSNANPQQFVSNLIQFNIPGSGVHTIGLGDLGSGLPLPVITTGTTIDGYSQPGATPNTLAVGDNAVLLIQILGDHHSDPLLGVTGGAGSLIRGLILNSQREPPFSSPFQFATSIFLDSPFNKVAGNFIGIAPDGNTFDQDSTVGRIEVWSSNNDIGGPNPVDRNLIGFAICSEDVAFSGDALEIGNAGGGVNGNDIEGNYIGINAVGFLLPGIDQAPRCDGISVLGSDSNFIGGNVIGGYARGIEFGFGAFGNLVQGNFIGADATGNRPAPNGLGIWLRGDDAGLNFIGALTAGNRIAFNLGEGVLIQGDSQRNTICCNSIFSNGALGIDISLSPDIFPSPDGVTPNDPGDADGGPNGVQNFPVLTQASSDQFVTNILGTLNSLPNTSFRIQFFSNGSCDPSGYGEGESFIGEAFVTTNQNGDASFNVSPLVGGLGGQFVTSTATNLSTGDTSEFSACVQAVGTQGTKVNGTIQRIDSDTHSFVLTTASGAVTILTDDTTKFRKNHKTVDFSALAVGDVAVVKGTRQTDGSILAKKVTVGGQEQDEVE